jgi:hypothetical protein
VYDIATTFEYQLARWRDGFDFTQMDDQGNGENSDPITLNLEIYGDGDPENVDDPSGHAGEGEAGLAFNLLQAAALYSAGLYSLEIADSSSSSVAGNVWTAVGLALVADAAITIGLGSIAETKINISEGALDHVLEAHTGNVPNKSTFTVPADEVKGLIEKASSVVPTPQSIGKNLQRIVDAGRTIGIVRGTGLPTSIYTVITDIYDNLVTAFPGTP